MVSLATDTTRTHQFDEKTLRLTLAEIARRSYGDGAIVNEALEEGWKQGVAHSMADGILTQAEETLLREFRDRLALDLPEPTGRPMRSWRRRTGTGSCWTPGWRRWPSPILT